jgi:predicted MFS family arabinose efflux permease
MKPMTGHLTTEAKTGRRVTILDIVGRYESRISLSGSLLVLAGNFALIPNISSYVQFNLGYPRAELDRLYMVGGVASFITLFFVGKWVDKYGAPRIAWIGALLYTVIVVLGFVHPIAAVPVLAIFPMFMVASSFRMIALNTLASRVPAAPERARFQSAQSAIQQVGSSAGALAASAYLTENPATHALIGIREIAYISLFINLVIPFIVMALARALVNRPALILADEPTANLDDANAAQALDVLSARAAEAGATLLIATHDARVRERFETVLALPARASVGAPA